jgi:hypothetical protein
MRVTFTQAGDFEAVNAAERWCAEHGISVGHMQGPQPRGLLFGEFEVAKWRNLNVLERAALHGTMSGSRRGPVTVVLKDEAVAMHRPQLLQARQQQQHAEVP